MATRAGKRPAKKLPAKKLPAKKLTKAAARKTSVQKTIVKKAAVKKTGAEFRLDLSGFPAESVVKSEQSLCVACVWQTFTRAMNMTPKAALAEMKRYTPSLAELTSEAPVRPFFARPDSGPCPYCGSPAKWHARIETHRIESGKATDALRR